jgi:MFS family permease
MVAGQIVTVLGSSLLRFALSLYVLDITGRADIFAAMFAVSNIPILLSPIGGAISDRYNRRFLMVLYDALCFGIALAFLLFMRGAPVFAVGAVMVLLGIVGAMETPNGAACVPLLVPENELEGANGIIQAVQALSGVAAPILGGILYGALGISALVAISCAAFGLAALMEAFIKIPFVKRPQSGSMAATIARDLKDGFAYVASQPFMRKFMILAALINFFLSAYILVGAPIILRVTMQSGDTAYGIGMGLINLATIIGALMVGAVAKKMSVKTLYLWILAMALILLPAALALTPFALGLGFYPSFIAFMLCAMPICAIATIVSIFVMAKVQKKTPNENLGKVMAIIMAVAQCAAPAGQAMYGFLFEAFSAAVYLPTLFAGAAMLVMAGLTRRSLRGGD